MPISIPKIIIALVHIFRLGQVFSGELLNLYYSYFSDLILPFGAYFLLTLNEDSIPILARLGEIFSLTSLAEICQFFGVEVLGTTFNPVDIVYYGEGILMAVLIDEKIISRYLKFW